MGVERYGLVLKSQVGWGEEGEEGGEEKCCGLSEGSFSAMGGDGGGRSKVHLGPDPHLGSLDSYPSYLPNTLGYACPSCTPPPRTPIPFPSLPTLVRVLQWSPQARSDLDPHGQSYAWTKAVDVEQVHWKVRDMEPQLEVTRRGDLDGGNSYFVCSVLAKSKLEASRAYF